MSIRYIVEKINTYRASRRGKEETFTYDESGRIRSHNLYQKLYLSLTIILLVSLSFGLGRLSVVGERAGVVVDYDPLLAEVETVPQTASAGSAPILQGVNTSSEEVVASSKGTKYHYSYCPGAKQISDKNKITFKSATEAERAGYTLALNCKKR